MGHILFQNSPSCLIGGNFTTATIDVSSLSDGTKITVTANHHDAAGNPATQVSVPISKDTSRPTVIVSGPSPSVGKFSTSYTYTVTYDGATSINLAGNVTLVALTGTATCNPPSAPDNATINISNCNGDGTVGIKIAAGVATNAVGNLSLEASGTALQLITLSQTFQLGLRP